MSSKTCSVSKQYKYKSIIFRSIRAPHGSSTNASIFKMIWSRDEVTLIIYLEVMHSGTHDSSSFTACIRYRYSYSSVLFHVLSKFVVSHDHILSHVHVLLWDREAYCHSMKQCSNNMVLHVDRYVEHGQPSLLIRVKCVVWSFQLAA